MIATGKRLRIAVFAPDIPYPPNRGGRADIWRRILAFRKLGHDVMLVNLQEPGGEFAPLPEAFAHIDSVVSSRFSFEMRRGRWKTLKQLALSWQVPWHAANRVPNAEEKQRLMAAIERFRPDYLWLDGPWFAVVCNELSERYGIPVLYRSHNIEHQYLLGQARAAASLRDRIAWHLACIGLNRFELDTMRRAERVFDISMDDLAYWESRGLSNLHWLPPLPELALAEKVVDPICGDLVFVGNLNSPNNLRGVEWLVTEVFSRVRQAMPNARCTLVGSNPTESVRRLAAASTGVELHENVPDTMPYLFGAKALANPVMTGSGVQLKTIDMLMTDSPIVTTSQGVRGLPGSIRNLFRVADNAEEFAAVICEEMALSSVDRLARAKGREVFSVSEVGRALDAIKRGDSDFAGN